jgi:enediyne biosynthesis protein E7
VVEGRPPGPSFRQLGRWCLRHGPNSFALLPKIADSYGDVVDIPLPLPGWTMTLLSHPDDVDYVMVRNHGRYVRNELTADLVPGEPDVLPVLEGEEWRRWRRELNPFFTENSLATLSESMAAAVSAGMQTWVEFLEPARWIDLELELGKVVMDSLMRSMFSTALDAHTMHRYVGAARDLGSYTIIRAFMSSLPKIVPRPLRRRGEAAQRLMLGELDKVIARRRFEGPRRTPDVLDALMAMSSEWPSDTRYRRLRTELASLIFAGFETTAESVSWAVALLHRNPTALAQAYAEVDTLGGDQVAYAHLDKMPYLRACFDETLRIAAPTGILRTTNEDDEIRGYAIPAGSHVLISPYRIHRDPRFWRHPERFEPNRFLQDKINRNAYIPFSIGPRKCMGWRMAYIDGLMTLAAILQRYEFEIRPGWAPKPKLRISTALAGGLPVRLIAR